jgi:NADP-reducing hydrogenase subunit HndB
MTKQELKRPMTAIQSLDDLKKFREGVLEKKAQEAQLGKTQVIVSLGSCGIAAGAMHTMQAILEQTEAEHLTGVQVSQTGCIGQCEEEPIVQVITGGQNKVSYGKVTPEVARRILREHVLGGKVVQEYVIEA